MAVDDDDLQAESRTTLIISLAVVFVVISSSSVLLRFYTRTRILRILGVDDITIGIAQVLAIAVSVTTVLEAVWGLGKHTQFVAADDATRQMKCLYANMMIYNASQIVTKISFLLQYRRLFPSERIQVICFWLLIFIGSWGIAQEFLVSFSCIPLTTFLPTMAGKCIYALTVWYLTSCMNIVTDFMILVIPIVPLCRLRVSKRKKYLLLSLFCLGFFTCIISLIRLSTLHGAIHTTDPFWDNAPAAYWSVVELNCGILCACLPTLRPLLSKIVPRLGSTHRGTSDPSSSVGVDTIGRKKSRDVEHLGLDRTGVYTQNEMTVHSTTQLNDTHTMTLNTNKRPSDESTPNRQKEGARPKPWEGDKEISIEH